MQLELQEILIKNDLKKWKNQQKMKILPVNPGKYEFSKTYQHKFKLNFPGNPGNSTQNGT